MATAKLTDEQKAANKAAKAKKAAEKAQKAQSAEVKNTPLEESEGVTLDEAMAEDGKTTADIGTKEKAEKVKKPAAPKKEMVARADGVEVPGYPRPGGKTRLVWDTLDNAIGAAFAAYHGPDAANSIVDVAALSLHSLDRKSLLSACVAADINPATCSTQYAQWRQFHMAKNQWAGIENLQNVLAQVESDKKAAVKEAADKVKADTKAAALKVKEDAKAVKKAEAEKVKAEKAAAKAAEKAAKEAAKTAAAETAATTEAPAAE